MTRRYHRRLLSLRTLLPTSFVAFVIAIMAAATAAAHVSSCLVADYVTQQGIDNHNRRGLEGWIATPQWSYLPHSNSQLLAFFGVIDDWTGTTCQGGQCQNQAGNLRGRICLVGGACSTTFNTRPYNEEYNSLSSAGKDIDVAWGVSSAPVVFYNNFYDGVQTSSGGSTYYRFSMYYVRQGQNPVFFDSAWRDRTNPIIVNQQEISPRLANECPNMINQEVGTYGYGTYIDPWSKMSILSSNGSTWEVWEGSYLTSPTRYWDFADSAYFAAWGHFVNKSANNSISKNFHPHVSN